MRNDELSTICHSSFITLHSSLTNRVNLHCRIALPVALFALVLFAPLLFEDDHFVAAPVFDHCAGDARACKSLRTGACAVVAVDRKHFKLHCLAGLLVERRHTQACARFDAKLLAARAYDCVSHLFHSSDAKIPCGKVVNYTGRARAASNTDDSASASINAPQPLAALAQLCARLRRHSCARETAP